MEQARTLLGGPTASRAPARSTSARRPRSTRKSLPDLAAASRGRVGVPRRRRSRRARLPDEATRSVAYLADGGPFGAPDLLALLPLQGVPLAQRRDLRGRRDAARCTTPTASRSRAPTRSRARRRRRAAGPRGEALASYERALAALAAAASPGKLAGLAVFTTGRPEAGARAPCAPTRCARPRRGSHRVTPPPTTLRRLLRVSTARSTMPDYQSGTPPYTTDGGAWAFDAAGRPIVDHTETARVVFTIPRAPTPPGGWPLVVFVRTGGGGDRPLVDRGRAPRPTFTTPITPGSGPARDLARVGFAAVEVDGPLGGARNPAGGDEDFSSSTCSTPPRCATTSARARSSSTCSRTSSSAFTFDAGDCGARHGRVRRRPRRAHGPLDGRVDRAARARRTSRCSARRCCRARAASYIANVIDKQKPLARAPIVELAARLHRDSRHARRATIRARRCCSGPPSRAIRRSTTRASSRRAPPLRADAAGHRRSLHPAVDRQRDEPRARPRRGRPALRRRQRRGACGSARRRSRRCCRSSARHASRCPRRQRRRDDDRGRRAAPRRRDRGRPRSDVPDRAAQAPVPLLPEDAGSRARRSSSATARRTIPARDSGGRGTLRARRAAPCRSSCSPRAAGRPRRPRRCGPTARTCAMRRAGSRCCAASTRASTACST